MLKHGHSRTPTHKTWKRMRERCSNPNHMNWMKYGGRGIRVCERWDDFSAFFADMGEPPENTTLERIDNNGNYEPGNCRWATRTEQARNRSSNRRLAFRGETLCMAEWSERLGIPYATIQDRIAAGWSVDDALGRPLRNYPHRASRVIQTTS